MEESYPFPIAIPGRTLNAGYAQFRLVKYPGLLAGVTQVWLQCKQNPFHTECRPRV